MTKKNIMFISVSLILLMLLGIGVSYSMWILTVSQTGVNTAYSKCFDLSITNKENNISLENAYPITNAKGKSLTPFTFTITNTCDINASYNINLESLNGTTLKADYLDIMLDSNEPKRLNSYSTATLVNTDSVDSRNLTSGILDSGKSKSFSLRIWIDYDTTLADLENSTKLFKGKIIVVGTPTNESEPSITDKIISQLDTSGKCPTVNEDGSVSVTAVEATNGYLCKAKDAYGDSYYYRGNVTNNYVLFADKYWRIVRINGDGTVRVIYDGTSAHANGEDSADRQIGTSVFNDDYEDNAYVGYMYGATGASTYAAAHANTNDSTIKAYIDNWYKTNILGTANEQYLADNVFCNDRSLAGNNTGTGAGTSTSYYRWYNGPWESESNSKYNNKMMLTCPQQNDAFTVSDTTKGNGALTYPVGLLSTDEIALAGGWNASNSGYYLYSGQVWWASSPNYFNGNYAYVRVVYSDGYANRNYNVNGANGVRPVFNLKADTLAQGSGTASDPYRISS
mgnify:CR=1 FL=1